MKKLISLSLFLFAVLFNVSAQDARDISRPQTTAAVAFDAIQQGNWIVGAGIGNIGHNFQSKTFSLDVTPRAGYFISDNAVIGAQVNLGLSVYDGGESFRYNVAPFVRYYFPEGAAPTHRWFGEAVVGLGGSTDMNNEDDAGLSRIYGISAGYAHFVASNVALEGTLGLVRSNANVEVGASGSQTGLSLGLALQIYLPGRNR